MTKKKNNLQIVVLPIPEEVSLSNNFLFYLKNNFINNRYIREEKGDGFEGEYKDGVYLFFYNYLKIIF